MSDPVDDGFELDGALFGAWGDIIVESFSPGSKDRRVQDVDSPTASARRFGRDLLTAATWTWSLSTNGRDEAHGHQILENLACAWEDEKYEQPGVIAALRYKVNGRIRRVYGRPGRFAYTTDVRRKAGCMPIDCDFRLADSRHYDDEEQVASLSIEPSHTGGATLPAIFPLTSLDAADERSGQIVVEGTAPTPLVIEITGPATRPWIDIEGLFRLQVEGTIPEGVTWTLDARPWALTATDGAGGSVAGAILPRRVSELVLSPGSYQITFGASASTDGASAAVRWRAASRSL